MVNGIEPGGQAAGFGVARQTFGASDRFGRSGQATPLLYLSFRCFLARVERLQGSCFPTLPASLFLIYIQGW